jgi:ribonuclease P protein component
VPPLDTPPPAPVRGGYPKAARLRAAEEFRRVRARGRRFVGRACVVRALRNDAGRARLGLATPRAYGSAVRRNRFRRLVREAFRALGPSLGAADFLVEPVKGAPEPTLASLRGDLEEAARRAAGRGTAP